MSQKMNLTACLGKYQFKIYKPLVKEKFFTYDVNDLKFPIKLPNIEFGSTISLRRYLLFWCFGKQSRL